MMLLWFEGFTVSAICGPLERIRGAGVNNDVRIEIRRYGKDTTNSSEHVRTRRLPVRRTRPFRPTHENAGPQQHPTKQEVASSCPPQCYCNFIVYVPLSPFRIISSHRHILVLLNSSLYASSSRDRATCRLCNSHYVNCTRF